MDLNKLKKGLFSTIKPQPPKSNGSTEQIVSISVVDFNYGFHQASRLGGTVEGLRTCLHRIYQDYRHRVRDDKSKQDELKKPHILELEELKGENARLEAKD